MKMFNKIRYIDILHSHGDGIYIHRKHNISAHRKTRYVILTRDMFERRTDTQCQVAMVTSKAVTLYCIQLYVPKTLSGLNQSFSSTYVARTSFAHLPTDALSCPACIFYLLVVKCNAFYFPLSFWVYLAACRLRSCIY